MKLTRHNARSLLLFLAVLFVSSCEDGNLVRQNEQLSDRVEETKKELALLKADIENRQDAQSPDIQQSNTALEKSLKDLESLKNERAELDKKHAELKKKLAMQSKEFKEFKQSLPDEK